MPNKDQASNLDLAELVAESNRASYEHAARKRAHANRIYWVLFLYVIVVACNFDFASY